jgi:hypothetical protein
MCSISMNFCKKRGPLEIGGSCALRTASTMGLPPASFGCDSKANALLPVGTAKTCIEILNVYELTGVIHRNRYP